MLQSAKNIHVLAKINYKQIKQIHTNSLHTEMNAVKEKEHHVITELDKNAIK